MYNNAFFVRSDGGLLDPTNASECHNNDSYSYLRMYQGVFVIYLEKAMDLFIGLQVQSAQNQGHNHAILTDATAEARTPLFSPRYPRFGSVRPPAKTELAKNETASLYICRHPMNNPMAQVNDENIPPKINMPST